MTTTHECNEWCASRATAEMLNATGFPTEVSHTEKSMGMVFKTVTHEGLPFRQSVVKAMLTKGSPWRPCFNHVRPAPVEHTPNWEVFEWFMSIKRPVPAQV